jgi:hypothetical protein
VGVSSGNGPMGGLRRQEIVLSCSSSHPGERIPCSPHGPLTTRVFHSKPDSHWFPYISMARKLGCILSYSFAKGMARAFSTRLTQRGIQLPEWGPRRLVGGPLAPPCHLCHLFSTTIYLIRPRPLDIHPPFILWLGWCPYYSMGRL